jgi:hypothetical protein
MNIKGQGCQLIVNPHYVSMLVEFVELSQNADFTSAIFFAFKVLANRVLK